MTETINALLDQWVAAEQAGDTKTLDLLLAQDFDGIGPLGFSLPKPEWLARHHQGLHYDAFDLAGTRVRTYGDAAVVTARNNQRGTYCGNSIPEAVRVTCVLIRQRDRWQLAAVHMSFIADAAGAPPIPGAASPSATTRGQS
jgi:ketosteroid isomerase-like protein